MPISLGDPDVIKGLLLSLISQLPTESNTGDTRANRRFNYLHAAYNNKGKEFLKNINSSNLAWIQHLSVRGAS